MQSHKQHWKKVEKLFRHALNYTVNESIEKGMDGINRIENNFPRFEKNGPKRY